MSKGLSLAKNTLIFASGKLSLQFALFIALPIYTHNMSPEQYGLGDLIITYMYLVVPAISLRSDLSAFRYLVDERKNDSKWKAIVSSSFANQIPGLLLLAMSLTGAALLLDIPHSIAAGVLAVSTILSDYIQQVTRGIGRNVAFSVANIVAAVAVLIAAYTLVAVLKLGIDGMLYALTISNLAAGTYLILSQRILSLFDVKSIKKDIQLSMLRYSTPLIPGNTLRRALDIGNRTLILSIAGPVSNGLYAVSLKYTAILNSIFSIFELSWMESASLHIKSPDRDKFFSKVADSVVSIFGSISLLLIAAVPVIFNILIGEGFAGAYYYIPLIMASVYLNTFISFYSSVYIAKKMPKKVMIISISSLVASISTACIFGLLFGIYGILCAPIVSLLVIAIHTHLDLKKYMDIRYKIKNLALVSIGTAIVSFFYYINESWSHIACITLALGFSLILNYENILVFARICKRTIRNYTKENFF